MAVITLYQDASEKLKVEIEEQQAVYAIKKITKWRKGDILKRFSRLGTVEHDRIIKILSTNY
jgi:energy-converting hydrogenase A subunit M